MEEGERAAFAALPARVIFCRGCGARNRDGWSWTLDKKIAERFTVVGGEAAEINPKTRKGYRVVTTTVSKSGILALFTRREENEVVVPSEVSCTVAVSDTASRVKTVCHNASDV